MSNLKYLILLINLIILNYVNCYESSLKNLFIVHRHGDRTPVVLYPNNQYSNESLYWPDGFGQLTSKGKKRMYNVGKFLRNRYGDFLGDSIRNVHVRSSDVERCLESTQLVVNGAFKPKDRWVWDVNQNWIPIPIHSMPIDIDSMMYPSNECISADNEFNRLMNSSYVKSIYKKYENLFKHLIEKTGKNMDIVDVAMIYDTLKIENDTNYQLPSWATADVLKEMEEISHIFYVRLKGSNKKLQRYRTGVFLHDLSMKIERAIKKTPKDNLSIYDNSIKKLNVYSTHDSFIAILLNSLQIHNGFTPPFGATIIFELHQHNESENSWDESNSIKIFYLNETETNKPYQMVIPDCQNKICTIKQFISSISDLILSPQNWVKECSKSLSN